MTESYKKGNWGTEWTSSCENIGGGQEGERCFFYKVYFPATTNINFSDIYLECAKKCKSLRKISSIQTGKNDILKEK